MKRVGVLVFPGVQALDLAGPLDVFAEANALCQQEQYQLLVIGTAAGVIKAANGMALLPDYSIDEDCGTLDLLLAAGGPALPQHQADGRTLRWLLQHAAKAERFGSICNGAFLLGQAGLLDGKTVTTHWQDAAALAAQVPQAKVEYDRIYCRDGRLVTSAGVTAGIDLCLALVAEDFGAELALKVAKRLVVFVQRQGGQSQFSPYLNFVPGDDSPLSGLASYVQQHIAGPLTVEGMARQMGMSKRSFSRAFASSYAVTPAEFVEQARIDAARQLLESGDMPLKTIAYHVGLSSAERLRLVFVRRLGISPQQYRANFQRSQTLA